jgi:hypothetical protein
VLNKRRALALLAGALLIGTPVRPTASTQPKRGSICVQPIAVNSGFMRCESGKLYISVDKGEPIPWPHRNPIKIDGLDLAQTHLVVASCGGKAVQSFRFRFTGFESDQLCVVCDTMFDGYEGLRVWDERHAPWCKKCK